MTNQIGRELTDAERASPEFKRALKAATAVCEFIRGETPPSLSALTLFDAVKEIEFWYRTRYKTEVSWR